MGLGYLNKEDNGQAGIDHGLVARVLSGALRIKATFHRVF
jgi:hypothetical protein